VKYLANCCVVSNRQHITRRFGHQGGQLEYRKWLTERWAPSPIELGSRIRPHPVADRR
jgi:hypothetical protein